jgi:regulator of replication initiation timing
MEVLQMKNWKLIVGIAVVALVSAGIGASVMAYVQSRCAAPVFAPRFYAMPFNRMPSRAPNFPQGLRKQPGAMSNLMEESLSEALGVSVEELEDLISQSEDWEEVAEQLDLTEEQLEQRLEEAHDLAIDKAVEEGYMDQEEAEWMREHMSDMWGWFDGGFPFGPRIRFFGRGGMLFHHPR